jgi:hypothetical protein
MDRDTQRLLAQLLAQEAQQLQERSQQEGVLAYLRRPLRRERPNERFLQNTLRSVQFNNRCASLGCAACLAGEGPGRAGLPRWGLAASSRAAWLREVAGAS